MKPDTNDFPVTNQAISLFKNDCYAFYTQRVELPKTGFWKNKIIARSFNTNENIKLYESNCERINSFKVVHIDDYGLIALWEEINEDKYTVHLGEFDKDFFTLRHEVLNLNIDKPMLLNAVISNDLIIIAGFDYDKSRAYTTYTPLNNLKLVANVQYIEDELSERYKKKDQSYFANISLCEHRGNIFLQAKLKSNTLRTWLVSVTPDEKTLNISQVFDLAYENMGYHQTYIDSNSGDMFVVYSENKILSEENNDIYVIRQSLYKTSTNQSEDWQRISQTNGYYFRPIMCKAQDSYYIFWEGKEAHYLGFNKDLFIVRPEDTLPVREPGNIYIQYNNENIFYSSEEKSKLPENAGKSIAIKTIDIGVNNED
ncbi:TPA: hypothetical protein ACXZLZ_004144 [Salmonella enterica]